MPWRRRAACILLCCRLDQQHATRTCRPRKCKGDRRRVFVLYGKTHGWAGGGWPRELILAVKLLLEHGLDRDHAGMIVSYRAIPVRRCSSSLGARRAVTNTQRETRRGGGGKPRKGERKRSLSRGSALTSPPSPFCPLSCSQLLYSVWARGCGRGRRWGLSRQT